MTRTLSVLMIVAVLAGCSTLPRDGPTGRNVDNGASVEGGRGSYAMVQLDFATSERIAALPPRYFGSLVGGASDGGAETIGAGDVLAVSIFEPGGSLFGSTGSVSPGMASRSSSQGLPALTVDTSGTVTIPFAGPVQVAGLTSGQAATAIQRSLAGKVANPQVVVSIAENSFNTVTVLGEVKEPGRARLTTNADRIIDVIADRGGAARSPEDVLVTVLRGGEIFTAPLVVVTSEFGENIRLSRGDQINLSYEPRRFNTFGALGAVSQLDMGPGALTLTGALSKVGGLDTNSANARSVLVFRFERPEVAQALGLMQTATARGVPVVYRLDMEQAEGFFIAGDFLIQPDDILYVPRSGSAELGKFFTLIRSITGAIYDISVTNTLSN